MTSVFVSAGWIFVVERDSLGKGGGAKRINVFNKRFQRMGAIRMAEKGGKVEQVLSTNLRTPGFIELEKKTSFQVVKTQTHVL